MHRTTLAGLFLAGGSFLSAPFSCRAQVKIEPIFAKSPIIARGHLEAGINHPLADGKSPLMEAIQRHDLEVVKYLLTHGADPYLTAPGHKSAFVMAAASADAAVRDVMRDYARQHRSPAAYFSAESPVLSIQGGQNQSASPRGLAPHLLTVLVSDQQGYPLVDAPIIFSGSNDATLKTGATSPPSHDLLLRTGSDGTCRVYARLPPTPSAKSGVLATAGSGKQRTRVTFALLSNDGTGGDSDSPFDVTFGSAQINPDNSANVEWTNQTEEEAFIRIYYRKPDGSWAVAIDAPARSTSIVIPNPPPGATRSVPK